MIAETTPELFNIWCARHWWSRLSIWHHLWYVATGDIPVDRVSSCVIHKLISRKSYQALSDYGLFPTVFCLAAMGRWFFLRNICFLLQPTIFAIPTENIRHMASHPNRNPLFEKPFRAASFSYLCVLEQAINSLGDHFEGVTVGSLKNLTPINRKKVFVKFKFRETVADSMQSLCRLFKSYLEITGAEYVKWEGRPIHHKWFQGLLKWMCLSFSVSVPKKAYVGFLAEGEISLKDEQHWDRLKETLTEAKELQLEFSTVKI